jgi:hypothetical protein
VVAQRAELTPQMLGYDDFDDRAQTRWLPYLMYFHRAGYRSPVINTDPVGFRPAHGAGGPVSLGGRLPEGPVRLFAGSSTALGIGAASDEATLPSRLWSTYAPSLPWLNVAGRSFNSAQELLLMALYRQLLPPVERIVMFSGLNNLALARLPEAQRGDSGGFFNCGEYFDQMEELRARHRRKPGFARRAERRTPPPPEPVRPLEVRIAEAVDLTVRHLEGWRLLVGAPITFVLQPLATWMRQEHAREERLLFAELDERSNFWELYGDIATQEAGRAYADALAAACEKAGFAFLDINPPLAEAVSTDDWLYVDRAHLTDHGHDVVARVLAEQLDLT